MIAGVGDRSYRTGSDTEGAATTDNPTTPFPTPPPTLTPNHRQASPFPLESTNSRRHHYNGSISSERSRNGNGTELIRAASELRLLVYTCNEDDTYKCHETSLANIMLRVNPVDLINATETLATRFGITFTISRLWLLQILTCCCIDCRLM